MLLNQFITESVNSLGGLYPDAEAKSIVQILYTSVLGVKNYTHIIEPGYKITSAKELVLKESMARLLKGEPVQYVLGYSDFCGFRFKLSPAVLIPRPETELLAMEVVKAGDRIQRMRSAYGEKAEPLKVLDLCTGSGCIAWTIALSLPGAEVVAVDISEEAISIAKSQDFASLLKEKGHNCLPPAFIKADVLDTDNDQFRGNFDIIVSNPPYVMEGQKVQMRKNVLDYEPEIALFVPDSDPLLFYKAISYWCEKHLHPDGRAFVEINDLLGEKTSDLFRGKGFKDVEVIKDLSERDRIVSFSK